MLDILSTIVFFHLEAAIKAMWYNHSVYAGWCSSTHRPLCETSAPPPFWRRQKHQRHFPTASLLDLPT
ncbi:hypothetical protein TNCV_4004061 [Trichonephila clavipes]|nr:hypothetical protein TNCV_4004061 [Trichonephila clavipes]